jgi:hypothetical protein
MDTPRQQGDTQPQDPSPPTDFEELREQMRYNRRRAAAPQQSQSTFAAQQQGGVLAEIYDGRSDR